MFAKFGVTLRSHNGNVLTCCASRWMPFGCGTRGCTDSGRRRRSIAARKAVSSSPGRGGRAVTGRDRV